MVVSRRTPHTQVAAPISREAIAEGQKIMRRVWRKGRTKATDPYWYTEAFTREGAINYIARQFKEPATNFDGV